MFMPHLKHKPACTHQTYYRVFTTTPNKCLQGPLACTCQHPLQEILARGADKKDKILTKQQYYHIVNKDIETDNKTKISGDFYE